MLHYRTRRRLFSTLVLIVAYVTLLSPIAFVMIASFDYGQRAYVVFPPDRFTLESSPCECGRPGKRLRYSTERIGKPMQTCKTDGAVQQERRVG